MKNSRKSKQRKLRNACIGMSQPFYKLFHQACWQRPKETKAKVHSKAKQTSIVLYSYSISLHFPPNKKEGSIPFLELHSFVVYATKTFIENWNSSRHLLELCKVSQNYLSNRCWKFQLYILKNKKCFIPKKIWFRS